MCRALLDAEQASEPRPTNHAARGDHRRIPESVSGLHRIGTLCQEIVSGRFVADHLLTRVRLRMSLYMHIACQPDNDAFDDESDKPCHF